MTLVGPASALYASMMDAAGQRCVLRQWLILAFAAIELLVLTLRATSVRTSSSQELALEKSKVSGGEAREIGEYEIYFGV